jgi:hypothetical protein
LDGRRALVHDLSGRTAFHVVDLVNGAIIAQVKEQRQVGGHALSDDGRYVLTRGTSGTDGLIGLWEIGAAPAGKK